MYLISDLEVVEESGIFLIHFMSLKKKSLFIGFYIPDFNVRTCLCLYIDLSVLSLSITCMSPSLYMFLIIASYLDQ